MQFYAAQLPGRISSRKGLACVVFNHQLLFAGYGNLGTLGAADQAGLELVQRNVKVSRNVRQNVAVCAGCCNLERRHLLGALVDDVELLEELGVLHNGVPR